jgi:hypothetical protein
VSAPVWKQAKIVPCLEIVSIFIGKPWHMAIDFYSIFTILIVPTAAFGYINHRFIKMPPTIGIMVIALLCSLLVVVAGQVEPSIRAILKSIIKSLHF